MIEFTAAPPVPLDYAPLKKALQSAEIAQAIKLGYVADIANLSQPVLNSRAFNVFSSLGRDLNDWRGRLFLVWFCYLYEEFLVIQKPLAAIEEILYEFQGGPEEFELRDIALASLYAGAAAREPSDDPAQELAFLEPYYNRAIDLLGILRHAT
ncbi:hypothetical protein [Ferrovibrio terrae]|uniref:hypothetical protein n=1 Tax=Ferrovibrio terrae TaxID=2594003 RepID=UPI0031377AF8